jgi:glycosyltransferase involved in cell wall biosynthesis
MKILISVSYYSPHLSGLTNSVKYLAELLAQNDYAVSVITTQHKKDLPLSETIQGVNVRRVPYFIRLHKGFIMPLFLFAAYREIKQVDQVLINLPQIEGVFVALLAKLLGKKVHCIYVCEVTLQNGLFSRLIEQLLRFSNRLSLFLSDTVITLTDDFAQHNQTLKALHTKIKNIYPVIKQPIINPKIKEILSQKITRLEKRFVIGFLGRISSEKGIEYLLEAIPFLQKKLDEDFVIVLAGPRAAVGEEAYRHTIAQLMERYKNHIVQLGELQDDELGSFYSLLDAFVLPSINQTEAFGMVQVEAMLCGTPVVVSDLPGVRVPVQKTGMGEIIPLKNAQAIADALQKVLTNKQRYIKDKSVIQEEFTNAKIIQSYKTIFT